MTLKTLLWMQCSVALVVGAGVTGVAADLVNPLIVLGPLGGWCVRRITIGRGVPYAGSLFLASAFACILMGAATSIEGSLAEAVARCFVSWVAQGGIYFVLTRIRSAQQRSMESAQTSKKGA
jgi:hypothetical protein